jgi:HIT zinc finger.
MTAPHTKSSSGCGVCGESNLAKYKCPKCRLPYCSVKCCKDHKVTCPAVQTNADTVNKTSVRINRNNSITDPNNTRAVSKYLAADELTQDPLLNSAKRKQMLRENEDDDPEDEGWHITQEMMSNVDNSEWLRKELADGGLRQIIMQIDNADEEMNQNRHGHGQQQRKRKRFQSGVKAYEYDPSPRELELMKAKR